MSDPGRLRELAELRAGLDAYAALVAAQVPVDRVHDVALAPGLPGRVYHPDGARDTALVWFHGGGYVAGSLDAIDPVCRWLARGARSTVVSVDYRLAPEHPFPAAVEDALTAVAAIAARPGINRVAVGGDSAGGGLAAAAAALTTAPLSAMVLLCPYLDLTVRPCEQPTDLTAEALELFAELYVGSDGDRTDPRASPLLTPELRGLPPTVIVAADLDPLGYQAAEYAERLGAAGVPAALRTWPLDHGFVGRTADLPEAQEALDWAAEQLRGLLDA